MTSEVSLPLWQLAALVVLAAWAALDRLLLPSVRWVLRRRVNRVIEELNTRLDVRLQPFKLTKRRVLIDRLVYDPQVLAAVEVYAREKEMPREAALDLVKIAAREIVPAFNAYFYFRVGYALTKGAARFLYRVRLGYSDQAAIAKVPPDATIVFLMNHRSNMDYVLVSYLAAERTALSYAVGEWARIWPLQTLIRATGAYFVRRDSGDPLYRKVLERYVQMATDAGVTQAVFPEGGLSRDGRLRSPRLGLLDYMLRTFDPAAERDLVFIPVGINYDRTLEDRTLLLDVVKETPRKKGLAALGTTFGFLFQNLWLMVRNEWRRFGTAAVNAGTPVSLKGYLASRGVDFRKLPPEERSARLKELAVSLMGSVAAAVPVLPVPLVATVLCREPERGLEHLELKAAVFELVRELRAKGAPIHLPSGDQDVAVDLGLRLLTVRHLVDVEGGLYRPRASELPVLRYYANSIAHLV